MSILNNVGLVPALMCAAIILAACGAVGVAVTRALDKSRHDSSCMASAFATAVCIVGCVALFITAGCVEHKHWDDHCHRLGGVLFGDSGCIKPHSKIDVP